MKQQYIISHKDDAIFLAIVSIFYYFLLRQHFMVSDDLFYQWIHPLNQVKVQSLSDALLSQAWDYFNFNGRVVVHSIVQFLCGVPYGRELFFIVGTIVHAFLLIGILHVLRLNCPFCRGLDKYLIVVGLFFLMPYYGMVFIGQISFVANYTWSACLLIWFYIIYQNVRNRKIDYVRIPRIIGCLFMGLLFGAWQESFTVPVAVTLFAYYLFHPKEIFKQNIYLYMLFFGFACGFFFETLAPANFARLGKEHHEVFSIGSVIGVIKACLDSIRIISLILLSIVGVCALGIKRSCHLFCHQWFFCLVLLFNVLFTAGVAYHDQRQLYVGVLSMIILNVILWFDVCKKLQRPSYVFSIKLLCVVALLMAFVPVYMVRKANKKAWSEAASKYKGNTIVAKDIFQLLYQYDANSFSYYYNEVGLLAPPMKAYAPISKTEVVNAMRCMRRGMVSIPGTDCYMIKIGKKEQLTDVSLEVSSRVSYLGMLLRAIHKETEKKSVININENHTEFIDGANRYLIVFYPSYEYPSVKLLPL